MIVLLGVAGGYILSNDGTGISLAPVSQNVQNAAPTPRGTAVPIESNNAASALTNSESAPSSATKNSTRSTAVMNQNAPSSSIGASSNNVSSKLLTNHSSSASHRSVKNTKIARPVVVDKSNETRVDQTIVDHSNSNTTVNQTIADASQTSSIGVIETASVHSQQVAAISPGEMREHYRLNPFEMVHNAQRSPWTVRISAGLGETFLNVPTGNSSYTTRTESSPFIGVNYSVSPSFAVGAVIGNSTILTVSPQTDVTEINGIKNVTVHTYSTNSQEWFARLASRYSIALGGSWNLETSAEAGMLLASKSPMVCLQALGSQNLSDAIDFQFGVLASGVWTAPTAIQNSSTDATTTSDVTVYRTHSQPAFSKIFSPAVTGRVGFQYRF
jgi:hypothetical protein